MGYVIFAVLLAVVGWALATIARERRQRSNAYEEGVTQQREALRRERMDSGEEQEWQNAIQYDPQVREAYEMVHSYGEGAIEELRRAFSVVEDRADLKAAAQKIISDRSP